MKTNYIQKKPGRPKTEFTQEQLTTFHEMASRGTNMATICDALAGMAPCVKEAQMWNRIKDDSDISQIYKNARALWKDRIAKLLMGKAEDENAPGSISVLIFLAKTQLRWSEPKEEIPTSEYSIIVRRTPLKN